MPPFEDQLPDESMPPAVFEFWADPEPTATLRLAPPIIPLTNHHPYLPPPRRRGKLLAVIKVVRVYEWQPNERRPLSGS